MGRASNYMPTGYYMNKQKKENDKYDGLLTAKQRRDLEGETELKTSKITAKAKKEKIRDQRIQGFGNTMQEPVVWGIFD